MRALGRIGFGVAIAVLAGCYGSPQGEWVENEVGVATQLLTSTGAYHSPYQLLDYNTRALETPATGDQPSVVPLSPNGLLGRLFTFVPVSAADPEVITSGDTLRILDFAGSALRHASSYATMGAQDSQSVWRITSTSGGGTIDPGEVFRLQATDNSRRLKSRSSGVRVLSWSGTTSNWRLGCSFVPGVYTEWTTRPTFSSATNPNEHVDLGLARSWLEAHVASVTLPFGEGTLIAWDDPNVDPDDPDNVDYFDPFNPGYVAYLMTDNLWAQHALEPFEPDLSGAIKDTIVSTGWYGDRLFDALFHHVGTLAVGAGQMADPDQGIPLGSCGTDDGRVVQVRAFDYTIDTEALAFGMQHLIDIAVYEAMNQYWGSTNSFVRNSARNKIRAIVQDTRGSWPDLMFWDTERAQLVDWLTREDFDDGGTYVFAPYKLGLVLYAIKVMGITDIPQTTIDRMKERLAEAQWSASAGQNSGGVAHLVEYDANHNFQLASPPTGEATSIAIMAHTVDEAP